MVQKGADAVPVPPSVQLRLFRSTKRTMPAGFTVWVSGELVLAAYSWVPANAAVIVCAPVPRVDVVNVARALVRGTVANVAAPSLKVTFPAGVALVADTVAVKVTAPPAVDGLLLDVRAVDV